MTSGVMRPPASPGYRVRLEVFEGPLDLLLHLIRREEMDIYDIPISRITQQYLEHLEQLAAIDLDRASEFLVMAALLMDIKSRMLLPRPSPPEYISAEDVVDPREELVRRLVEYKRYKEAASLLTERAESARRSHSRFGGPGGPPLPAGFGNRLRAGGTSLGDDSGGRSQVEGGKAGDQEPGSIETLFTALKEVLRSLEGQPAREISRETLTVADKIEELVPLLAGAGERGLEFIDILRRERSRRAIVVVFLALLELLRQGRVRILQGQPFGPIRVWALPNLYDWGWPGRA